MGRFENFYNGAIQHPWLLWLALAIGLWFVWRRDDLHPSLRRTLYGLGVLSFVDAWWTSAHVYGVGTLEAPWSSWVPLFFVLAGDFRYLLLVCAGTLVGGIAPTGKTVAAALGWTLLVPAFSQGVLAVLPESMAGSRTLFFVYEVAFFVLAACLLTWHKNCQAVYWLRSVSLFVMLYYGLWAGVDAFLLATGSDVGFALRMLPNWLYYGGLIGAIAWMAPAVPTDPPR
ncbi:MAG: hypothetical protein AAF430_16205 [Myxococcota bacterium]